MVQNMSWEWLLEGFKIALETQLKPKTIKDYCYHISYFAHWAKDSGVPPFLVPPTMKDFSLSPLVA